MNLLKRLKAADTFKAKEVLLPASDKQIHVLWTVYGGHHVARTYRWPLGAESSQPLANIQQENGTSISTSARSWILTTTSWMKTLEPQMKEQPWLTPWFQPSETLSKEASYLIIPQKLWDSKLLFQATKFVAICYEAIEN